MNTLARVPGWDFLRGLCALAVAIHHLFFWQDIAVIYTFGSYGVYLFFILSGASLAYTYLGKFEAGQLSIPGFLRTRYLRLAPLYVILMLILLPWKLQKSGLTTDLVGLYAINASLLFGFYSPVNHAVLVGGWSLGIEVIFYFLFPLVLWCLHKRGLALAVFCFLLALQLIWIQGTLGASGGYGPNITAFHQAPAFAAYFMGGCLLGAAKRRGQLGDPISQAFVLICLLAGFGLLLGFNTATQGDEILGWRGFFLFSLCFVMVYISTRLQPANGMQKIAATFGDATYGLYLLHPVLFFGLTLALFPRLGISAPNSWPVVWRLCFAIAIIFTAFGLALLSEKYLEKPIRRWAR